MGILGFLTGNSKSVEKVVSAGISGIDKLIFTDEEKADYHKELQKLHLKFIEVAANESSTQSVSRRVICLPVVYAWLLLILLNVFCDIVLNQQFSSIAEGVEQMSLPALAAIGFYVGRHIVSNK